MIKAPTPGSGLDINCFSWGLSETLLVRLFSGVADIHQFLRERLPDELIQQVVLLILDGVTAQEVHRNAQVDFPVPILVERLGNEGLLPGGQFIGEIALHVHKGVDDVAGLGDIGQGFPEVALVGGDDIPKRSFLRIGSQAAKDLQFLLAVSHQEELAFGVELDQVLKGTGFFNLL